MENTQTQVIEIAPTKEQELALWLITKFMFELYYVTIKQLLITIINGESRPTRDEMTQRVLASMYKHGPFSPNTPFSPLYSSWLVDYVLGLVDKRLKAISDSNDETIDYPIGRYTRIPIRKKYVVIDRESNFAMLPIIGHVRIGKPENYGYNCSSKWTLIERQNSVWICSHDLPEDERKSETPAVEETKPEAAPATQEEAKTESQPTSVTITLDLGNSDNVTLSDGSTITLPKRILNHIKNVRNLDEELKTVDNEKRVNNVLQRRMKTMKTLAKYLYTFMKTVIYNADKWYSTMRIEGFMFGDDDLSMRTFNGYKSQLASYARSVQRVVIFGKGEADAPAGDDEFFDTIRRIRNKISK